MLRINDLYKERRNNVIKDVNFLLGKGEALSLECRNQRYAHSFDFGI